GQQEVPAIPPERVVDPTGAGDAFRAGFYAGDYHGYGLRDSAVIGGSSASFAIEAKGGLSQVPGWEEVLARADPFLI
ncbi:MAG: PfkB family carbohydrate kinase, partial [Methanomassiliicoccales archaeon]